MGYFSDIFLPRLAQEEPQQAGLIEALCAGYKICHPDGTGGSIPKTASHGTSRSVFPDTTYLSAGSLSGRDRCCSHDRLSSSESRSGEPLNESQVLAPTVALQGSSPFCDNATHFHHHTTNIANFDGLGIMESKNFHKTRSGLSYSRGNPRMATGKVYNGSECAVNLKKYADERGCLSHILSAFKNTPNENAFSCISHISPDNSRYTNFVVDQSNYTARFSDHELGRHNLKRRHIESFVFSDRVKHGSCKPVSGNQCSGNEYYFNIERLVKNYNLYSKSRQIKFTETEIYRVMMAIISYFGSGSFSNPIVEADEGQSKASQNNQETGCSSNDKPLTDAINQQPLTNLGESVMNTYQKSYTAFMESVCNKFNCPDALPALEEGFKAFCETFHK